MSESRENATAPASKDTERALLSQLTDMQAKLARAEDQRRQVCAAILDVEYYVNELAKAFGRARDACAPVEWSRQLE